VSTPHDGPVPGHAFADPGARIAELIARGDAAAALRLARALHSADLAAAVSGLDTAVRELVVREFAPAELAALLEYLDPHYRDLLLEDLPPDQLAEILADVSDDIAADAVQEMTGPEAAQVVSAIPAAARDSIRALVGYAPDTAAGRMTGQRLTVSSEATVEQVIETLRAVPAGERVPTVYATSPEQELVGVVNLRALVIAEPEARVGDIAEPIVTVAADTDQEDAARILKQYNVPALPVVDGAGRLLGTLTADDLLHVLEEEVTEDMFRLAGVHEEEDLESIPRSVRYRLPWLYANLVTVLLAAWVVSLFEGTLAQVAVLAAFLPVVAAQGGNAGIQTVTVVVRSLALGRIAPRNTLRVVRHELATGLVTGLASALVVGVVAWLWQDNAWLGGLLAIAVTGDVLVGVAAGVVIPIALHSMRQDPALSAGIWLTTVTDVCGFFLYLGLASLIVTRL
jgi:magnesium transporter